MCHVERGEKNSRNSPLSGENNNSKPTRGYKVKVSPVVKPENKRAVRNYEIHWILRHFTDISPCFCDNRCGNISMAWLSALQWKRTVRFSLFRSDDYSFHTCIWSSSILFEPFTSWFTRASRRGRCIPHRVILRGKNCTEACRGFQKVDAKSFPTAKRSRILLNFIIRD